MDMQHSAYTQPLWHTHNPTDTVLHRHTYSDITTLTYSVTVTHTATLTQQYNVTACSQTFLMTGNIILTYIQPQCYTDTVPWTHTTSPQALQHIAQNKHHHTHAQDTRSSYHSILTQSHSHICPMAHGTNVGMLTQRHPTDIHNQLTCNSSLTQSYTLHSDTTSCQQHPDTVH